MLEPLAESSEIQSRTAPNDCSDGATSIRIEARNHLPVPKDGGKNRQKRRREWREHIIVCASAAIAQAAGLGEYGSWLFTVDVEFYLDEGTKTDIDNLAKPVIDTLFKPGKKHLPNQDPAVTAKVFPHAEDGQVRQLNLRKTLVRDKSDYGATITVCWTVTE